MPSVQTVLGPVDASDLGPTLIHEHVQFRDEAVRANWPSRYDEAAILESALTQVRGAKEKGITTIVDPTAMFGGRDIRFMQRVSQEAGVHIVACTGIYTYDYLPHYFESRSEDVIADHFVEDLEAGVQGTDARAAFIKTAADAPRITPNVEKLHRAAARASLRTGAPIMAHSRPESGTGPRQVEIFLEEGVDPAKIQIAHTGDSEDLGYIEGLLDQGVWIGLDRYGLPMFLPTPNRNAVTAELLRRGHAGRIFISQDHTASIDWFPEETVQALMDGGLVEADWSMTYIWDHVLPVLREQGVLDDAVYEQIFVENPRRWLAG